jgi:hypothetical protein
MGTRRRPQIFARPARDEQDTEREKDGGNRET